MRIKRQKKKSKRERRGKEIIKEAVTYWGGHARVSSKIPLSSTQHAVNYLTLPLA